MTFKKLKIDSRLAVKSLSMSAGYQIGQIFISDLIFNEENKVIRLGFSASGFIEARGTRNVDLTADYRLDSCVLTSVIKSDNAVHNTVVGYRNSSLTKLFCSLRYLTQAASTVKQAVFSMQMKMYEIGHRLILLSVDF